MLSIACLSICYNLPAGRRLAAGVLLCVISLPVMTGTVYQWTDAAGVTHFSDTAPPVPASNSRELETVSARPAPAQGLRPGERATLRAIEQRRQTQHRTAQQTRERNDHAVAARRRDCRERRNRQRDTGNHAARRALATYLRRHCW